MKPAFKAEALQEKFEKYGYIIVRNFISQQEIEYLWKIYDETKDIITDRSFYISQWTDKNEMKMKISNAVTSVIQSKAEEYLNGYTPVFGVFGVKHPKPDSAMYLHADWAHVDETLYRTVNIWCPLLQIDETNGSICLVKGSHRLFDYIRGVGLPDAFYRIGEKNLFPYLTDIYLNAGDVIMWDHRVIHGSRVNFSKGPRVAAVLNMRPVESKFYLYYGVPDMEPTAIEVYAPPANFFVANDSANDPELIKQTSQLEKTIDYRDPDVDENKLKKFLVDEFPGEFPQLEEKVEEKKVHKKESFLSKLFSTS
jgi:ectoine hydroxylase-related dioxygenase (phytanoyl-CoA dioxygenase family)